MIDLSLSDAEAEALLGGFKGFGPDLEAIAGILAASRDLAQPQPDANANASLYRIVLTRMSSHQETRAYVARRRAEGLSTPEVMRCLKRYVARQVFKQLPRAA